jgi:hypothetical protein
MPNMNPMCDGGNCRAPEGEVRLYPLGGGGNLILCHACWASENRYRYLKGVEYGRPEDWPQLDWAKAVVYGE